MSPTKRAVAVGVCLAMAGWSVCAADFNPPAQREVGQLLDRIESSNCTFNRNGSWYSASEARKHLQLKLDYMVERKMLATAEDFIANAASESSMSGKAYLMRCGSQEVVASAAWLNAELKRIRTPN